MRNMNRGWTLVCCLVAVGALALGCGKGEPSKSKTKGSASMGSNMGGMGGRGAATPGPKRPGMGSGLATDGATATGSRAGVKVWSPKWPKEHKSLTQKFVKAAKKKDYPAALTVLAEMKKLAPHVLNVEYKLAYIKALSGDAKGALAHLRVLLFAHYPKYSFKVATDKDLDALKTEPFKGQLDKLVEAARVEHVAAWKKAAFFIGANMRAFQYKRSVRGNQEIYGYLPETGRIVCVTYVDAANALGYLVTPDKTAMIYVAASKFVSDEGPPAFSDVEVHALSLTTGKRLKVWTHTSHPGGGFHGQVPGADAAAAADAAKPREVKPGDAGVVDIKIEQFKSGAYRLSVEAVGVGDVADKKLTWDFGLNGDAVIAAPPSDKNYRVNHLRVRMCGAKAKRLAWARKIKKDGDTFAIGGKAVTFACAGLVWRSPDAATVVFQPYRYCRKHASGLDGLYVVDAAGKFTQVSPKHDAWDITWSGNHHALLQFGGQVGFVDVQTPTFKLLGPPAAHLRAFGPRAIKKCED
jgi:hypothetical protein